MEDKAENNWQEKYMSKTSISKLISDLSHCKYSKAKDTNTKTRSLRMMS